MGNQGTVAVPRAAGMLLVLSFVANMAGVVLFSAREGTSGQPAPSFAYVALERSLVVGAAVIAALGLAALAAILGEAQRHARVPARVAAATYAVATAVLVVAEARGLRSVCGAETSSSAIRAKSSHLHSSARPRNLELHRPDSTRYDRRGSGGPGRRPVIGSGGETWCAGSCSRISWRSSSTSSA